MRKRERMIRGKPSKTLLLDKGWRYEEGRLSRKVKLTKTNKHIIDKQTTGRRIPNDFNLNIKVLRFERINIIMLLLFCYSSSCFP